MHLCPSHTTELDVRYHESMDWTCTYVQSMYVRNMSFIWTKADDTIRHRGMINL